MLFNSIGFLFAFLPAVLAIYYALAFSPLAVLRRPFLIAATLVFYGLGGWEFVPLLLGSLALNFLAAHLIARARPEGPWRALLLAGAIAANVAALAYFKYFAFLLASLNAAVGSGFAIEPVILPLAISFYTFQQIGYLVDVSRDKFAPGSALDYASWVLFFPQLLAGPIVQYGETAPQLRASPVTGRIGGTILIGLVIFAIGLFKKTVVADSLALYAQPVFAAMREGQAVGFVDGWLAALAYTAQVYFDFSGYSDMAIGTARMFGIVLPLNFHSPLRSGSVVEIWRRWHITLGRWVQAYVFQPVSLPLARLAARRRAGEWPTLVLGVVVPTMIAMTIVGVWHGAGWPFVVFGLLQGLYMSVNEGWAVLRRKARKARRKAGLAAPAWHRPIAVAATLVAFVVSIVPFGSATMGEAGAMWAAMAGTGPGLVRAADWPLGLAGALGTVALAYGAIFLMPNTLQIMGRFDPVLDWRRQWQDQAVTPLTLEWRMTPGWALAASLVLFLGVAFVMRGTTQFIYFNF